MPPLSALGLLTAYCLRLTAHKRTPPIILIGSWGVLVWWGQRVAFALRVRGRGCPLAGAGSKTGR